MPEGHTIHRLAQDLARDFEGHVVTCSSPQGRFPEAPAISGHVLRRTSAIGKHLFLDIGKARVHVHLGLFGRFRARRKVEEPRPTIRLRIEGNGHTWDLSGPTACEVVDDEAFETLRARLGGDPLAEGKRAPAIWQRVHASKRAIGALLLDQSIFAGIGNVYRAELLFLAKLHPETEGKDVSKESFELLWKLAKDLLRKGVTANRIITVPGSSKRRRDQLYVYKRKECRVCSGPIASGKIAARTLFWCPRCQPYIHARKKKK